MHPPSTAQPPEERHSQASAQPAEHASAAEASPTQTPVPLVTAEVIDEPEEVEVITAELIAEPERTQQAAKFAGRLRSLAGWIWRGLCSAGEWIFGACSLVAALAVLATFPLLNLLSLGYLLEASGRVARSGRIRDGFVGVRKAARAGGIVLGTLLCLLPLWPVSKIWASAELIDPHSGLTSSWRLGLSALAVLSVGHILWAWCRGGRLRHFFWPAPIRFLLWLSSEGKYAAARDAVWNFFAGLRLRHYFWLGVRGFAGALAWLMVPVGLLILASQLPPGGAALLGLLGGLLLALVLLYLPFLQTHFAAEDRFAAMFELGTVRGLFRSAPIAFWLALAVTLLFALPLYLLKIELTPREVAVLPSLVFVAFIFPARLLAGWAVGRARKHHRPRFFLFRWLARLGTLPVVGFYVLIVYFTQYLSWYGSYSLLEQHAFLVPAPFLDL